MSICYSDERQPFTGSIDTAKIDAVKGYLTHYQNLLYLTFIANHALTSVVEKAQARKELVICERKLKWWQNLPRYDQKAVLEGIARLKSEWAK
jgi:hypothetical protein